MNILNDPLRSRPAIQKKPSDEVVEIGDDDSPSSSDDSQIDHLIFFVHGVGGVCDVSFRSCVEVVADFKKMANNLLNRQSQPSSDASTSSSESSLYTKRRSFFRKHSSESSSSGKALSSSSEISPQRIRINSDPKIDSKKTSRTLNTPSPTPKPRRIECLPVSWHSCTRRQTGMNDQLSLISLASVPKLRHFLNKVVLDAILYSSGPVYAQTILNNVGNEINRLYTLFIEKYPNFKGSVSLAGHSLGSVILFDLLANQIPHKAPPTKQDSSSSANISVNDNYDSNHNNQPNNIRLNCANVSHHHHDFPESETSPPSCTDYKNLDELLKDLNLSQYAGWFRRKHIDLSTLLLLNDLDMKELRLPLGARRKLGTYINYKKISLIKSNNCNYQHEQSTSSTSEEQASKEATKGTNANICDNTGLFLLKYPQLKFKPRCFFSFGSPTSMFLNIRGVGNISKKFKFPTCDKMFNIFHPYDPLAYRIEPLIEPRFKNIKPVQIPHHRGGKRIHVQLREGFARVGHDLKRRLLGSLRDTLRSFTSDHEEDDDEDEHINMIKRDSDSNTIGELNGGRRLDYVLQEKPIELFNEYIFAFTSHANYWQNEDSALIILNEIYQEDGIQLFECYD